MTGIRYTAWRRLELSAVTLPMNQDASIELVRAFNTWGGAEAFAAHHEPLLEQLGPAAELADSLEPVVCEIEAMRAELAVLKADQHIDDDTDSAQTSARGTRHVAHAPAPRSPLRRACSPRQCASERSPPSRRGKAGPAGTAARHAAPEPRPR
jgi:hypothetical protein